ncbi:hypothetical protein [Secundilactobacillus silagincola]|nr:hypothetical protein [Secundilactobacillus silagincola]
MKSLILLSSLPQTPLVKKGIIALVLRNEVQNVKTLSLTLE